MYKKIISLIAVSALFFGATVMAHTIAKKGMKADLVLMPKFLGILVFDQANNGCLLYTSPSPRDLSTSRMPSSA